MEKKERFRGCLLGLACGDAVGTAVEFSPRGTFSPVVDMIGGGPFNLAPGQWTDDTSMALCLAESLIAKSGFDAKDQMERYVRWANEGHMSSTGRCFDIGSTVSEALERFQESGDPFAGSDNPFSAGNGALMRLAPIPMYFLNNRKEVLEYSEKSSMTTHRAPESLQACRVFSWMIAEAMAGASKEKILFSKPKNVLPSASTVKIEEIFAGTYKDKSREQIKSSGYVIHSLEAALWSFWTSNTYEDAILTAVNLGDDTDTVAAICGQLAGAYYGEAQIPANWRNNLAHRSLLESMADMLWQKSIKKQEEGQRSFWTKFLSGLKKR